MDRLTMRLTESIIFFRDKRNELLSYEKIWRKLKCIFLSHNEWLAFICANLKRLLAVCCSVLSRVQLFVTQWTGAHQVSLSFTVSQSLLKLMSFEAMMPSNCFILCRLLLFLPSIFTAYNLFQWVSSLHQVAKVLELQLQHLSFQWILRIDFL